MGTLTSTSWKQGTSGNPRGRPKREAEREYLTVVMRLCPPETWALIVEKAVVDAQAGDAKAREWLARYLLPATPIDPFMDL